MVREISAILAVKKSPEEKRAVLSIQDSVGTPQFDTLQAVRKVMLNFVRVFLQFELEGQFLHILWPMTIQQLPFDIGFENACNKRLESSPPLAPYRHSHYPH
jgi:hypothetical protein